MLPKNKNKIFYGATNKKSATKDHNILDSIFYFVNTNGIFFFFLFAWTFIRKCRHTVWILKQFCYRSINSGFIKLNSNI